MIELDLNKQIEMQRKRIIKKDEEKRLIEAQNRQKNMKKKVVTESTESEIKGKDYHIEAYGQYTIYKKPEAERLPKQYLQPLKADLTQPVQVLKESDFNKTIKDKRSKGLIKDESVNTIS